MDLLGGAGNDGDITNDDDAEANEAMAIRPEQTYNPTNQRFYNAVQARALDESVDIFDVADPLIEKYMNQNPGLLKRAAPQLAAFARNFPLKVVEKKAGKRKRHWRDMYGGDVDEDADMRAAKAQRQKTEAKGPSQAASQSQSSSSSGPVAMSDIVVNQVEKISSVSPVQDFKDMLSRRDRADLVEKAIAQMHAMIKTIVTNSFQAAQFPRALECLQALRRGCIEQEEAELYNAALTDIMTTFSKTKAAFCALVADAKPASGGVCNPISSDDVESSDVTPQQSAAFFLESQASQPAAQASVAATVDGDDDSDFFDEMD
jgi:ATP-dependent DNA helicase 2 subunit 2